MALKAPQCYKRNCKYFTGIAHGDDELKQVPICTAFPDGIPDDIAYGSNLHLQSAEGDHGIKYEKAEG
jgi:hypothetical protein